MKLKINNGIFGRTPNSLRAAVTGVTLMVAAPIITGCEDLQRGFAAHSDNSYDRRNAISEMVERKHLIGAKLGLISVACKSDHKDERMRAVRELKDDPESLGGVRNCDSHEDSKNYAEQRLLEMLGTIKNEYIVAEMGKTLLSENDNRWRIALRNLETRVDSLTNLHALAFVAAYGSPRNAQKAEGKIGN